MPTITLPTKTIIKLSTWNGSLETLAERIAMLGTDVEYVTEEEIRVEIFPNRPDLLSHTLFAKALRDFTSPNARNTLFNPDHRPSGKKIIVTPQMKRIRPYTLAALITNLTLSEEDISLLVQLQEKLDVTHHRNRTKAAAGMYPAENITWPITFTTIHPDTTRFTPLGMTTPLTAREILTTHPKGKAYAHLLEQHTAWPAFIDANNTLLSIPPIVNSEAAGRVTPQTRSIFIEVSGHHLPTIRTSLAILTATLILLGGTLHSITITYPDEYDELSGSIETPDFTPREVQLTRQNAERIIGIKLTDDLLDTLLARMGLARNENNILIPTYRADIHHPIDIIEDITIAYGYENIPSRLPSMPGSGMPHPKEEHVSHIRNILTSLGYHETYTHHLVNRQDEDRIIGKKRKPVIMENPLTEQTNSFRRSILTPLLLAERENQQEKYPHKLFSLGRIAHVIEKRVHEEDELALLIADPGSGISALQQDVQALFHALGMKEITYTPLLTDDDLPAFWPGRGMIITHNGKHIGMISEIKPALLSELAIYTPVFMARITLPLLPLKPVKPYQDLTDI